MTLRDLVAKLEALEDAKRDLENVGRDGSRLSEILKQDIEELLDEKLFQVE